MNFSGISKTVMRGFGSTVLHMAMIASPLATGAASSAYYASRRGAYGRNNSYLIDEELKGLRSHEWETKLKVKRDKTNLPNALATGDLVLKKSVAIRELVVVDGNVKNQELFSKLLKSGVEILRIDANGQGFDQLMIRLSEYEELNAIHLFANNQGGQVLLGNQLIAQTSLENSIQAFSSYNDTLKEGGELLIYNTKLEDQTSSGGNLSIITGTNAPVNKNANATFNAEDLRVKKGDINAYPEEGSIARLDVMPMVSVDDVTFSDWSSATDLGTKTVTLKNGATANGSYTLQVTATSKTIEQYAANDYVYHNYAETVWRFSLTGGESFTIDYVQLYENLYQYQTIYLKSSNGALSINWQ